MSDTVSRSWFAVFPNPEQHGYQGTPEQIVEKLTVKVPKDVDVPMNSHVRLVNVYATVYGNYRNQLSVTADDIEVIKK